LDENKQEAIKYAKNILFFYFINEVVDSPKSNSFFCRQQKALAPFSQAVRCVATVRLTLKNMALV